MKVKGDNMETIKMKKARAILVLAILILSVYCKSNVVYAASNVETVNINKESLVIYEGDSEQLKINGSEEVFQWESLDKSVVVVDDTGKVTAVGVGSTHVIAQGKPKSYLCYVIVKESDISKKSITVYQNGSTETLTINGKRNEKTIWKSENEKIAKVTSLGEVIGLSIGKTRVVAMVGGESYSCEVTVKSTYISKKKINIKEGESFSISVVGSKDGVHYKSVDESVATIDQNGNIFGVKEGITSIVATYNKINYYAKVIVTKSRLSVNADEIWMNQEKTITITLKDRKKEEDIIIEDSKGIIDIKRENWRKDSITVTLTPLKDGETELRVLRKDSSEEMRIGIHATVRRLLTAEEIYKKYVNACVSVISYDAVGEENVGSGFFIDSGMLLTNYHVIEYANELKVEDINGKSYEVKGIYDYDVTNDLALLEVEKTNDTIFFINRDEVKTGETIYTLGSPVKYAGTISDGMVSYAKRIMDEVHYIQFSAPISQSSGGGPLINAYGEVIGVNTLTMPLAQNINLAVKIGYINRLNLKNKRPIEYFYEENKDKVMDKGYIEIIIG